MISTLNPDSAAAAAIFLTIDPAAAAALPSRIAGLDRELSAIVEDARLNERVPLIDCLGRFRQVVAIRAILEDRAAALGGARVERQPAAAEIAELAMRVRRYRSGEEFRNLRRSLISRARADAAAADTDEAALVSIYRSGAVLTVGQNSERALAGLNTPGDELIGRVEAILSRRRIALERLQRLDPHGDTGRAAKVFEAIDGAGGADELVAALAGTMHVETDKALQAANRELRSLREAVAKIDPETERSAEMRSGISAIEARLTDLHAAAAAERNTTAAKILEAAVTGDIEAIASVGQVLRASQLSDVADRFDAATGDVADWPGTVSVWMEDRAIADSKRIAQSTGK